MLYTYINGHAGTPDKNINKTVAVLVGHSHLRSIAAHAFTYILYIYIYIYISAGRMQPILPLVDRELEFSTCWSFLVRKNPSYRDSQLMSQRVRRLRSFQLRYRGVVQI